MNLNDMLMIIGRQTLEIELIRRQLEQMKTLAQSEQKRANEAQLLAKQLYNQQNGAEKKQAIQTPT